MRLGLLHVPAAAPQGALAQIYRGVQQQAAMLSYIDTFWVLMVFVAVIFPTVWFLRTGKDGQQQAAAG